MPAGETRAKTVWPPGRKPLARMSAENDVAVSRWVTFGDATNVPEPCRRISRSSATSWSTARRRVIRATPRSRARSRSTGNGSPGDSVAISSTRLARTRRCLAVSRPASTDVMDHWYSMRVERGHRSTPPGALRPWCPRWGSNPDWIAFKAISSTGWDTGARPGRQTKWSPGRPDRMTSGAVRRGAAEDVVEHGFGEATGEGVLLAGVVAAEQGDGSTVGAGEHDRRAVAELRAGPRHHVPGRGQRVEGAGPPEPAQGHDHAQGVGHQRDLLAD